MASTRRGFLRASGVTLSITAGGGLWLTPREARSRNLPYLLLSQAEVATLEALGDSLVPGAREAGLAQFIDKQLSSDPESRLLMLKYLGVPLDDAEGFYRGALAGVDALARSLFQQPLALLEPDRQHRVTAALAAGEVGDWQGPPAPLVFFVLRSDACDVVYGTEAGFAAIGMPYLPHIAPARPW